MSKDLELARAATRPSLHCAALRFCARPVQRSQLSVGSVVDTARARFLKIESNSTSHSAASWLLGLSFFFLEFHQALRD